MFPPTAKGQWIARWRSLHSNAAGACWNFIKQKVLWLCSMLSNSNLMCIRQLTSPFWSGTGISLKEDASVIRERDIQADRRSRSKLLIASENSFLRSPRKSTCRASRELRVPQSAVSKILRKRLRLYPYKLQLVRKLHPEDKEINQLVDSTTSCWKTLLPFSARWGAATLASRCPHISQRALAKHMDWPLWTKWPGVLQVAPDITGPDRLWLFPLGVREGQGLCTSTTRNRGWAAGTHHCRCQLGHAWYAAESLVRARLSHRCLPSNKDGHIECVCDTTWNCMSLCNCSHQFCKNIPVSFDFITTWNQGMFLWSLYNFEF